MAIGRSLATSILQADAYGGYGELYRDGREPAPLLEAGCFAHARRKFFGLADVEAAARKKNRGERTGQIYPIALEAVQRLDALFDIERRIIGMAVDKRLAVRQELSAPLVAKLHAWLTAKLARLSRNHDCGSALKRDPARLLPIELISMPKFDQRRGPDRRRSESKQSAESFLESII